MTGTSRQEIAADIGEACAALADELLRPGDTELDESAAVELVEERLAVRGRFATSCRATRIDDEHRGVRIDVVVEDEAYSVDVALRET